MADIENHRWNTKPDEFAVRIDLPDAPGFFKKSVVVEAGTRALVIDEQYQGEIFPGQHTMESFIEKLKFWKQKQATIVLTRLEDHVLEFIVTQVPTAEHLLVNVSIRLAVKIDDVEDFFNNMMGAQQAISLEKMQSFIEPILRQAVWEAVRGHSIEELTGSNASQSITDGISEQLKLRLLRYGINFVNVHLVAIYHEKYNEQQEKEGEIWLQREGVEQQARIDEVYSQDELRKIKNHERQNELRILAKTVDVEYYDQKTGVSGKKVESMARRIEVRNDLRGAMLSDKMNAVNSKEELAALMQEVDKDKLIRQEETDVLLEEFDRRKDNRDEARDHLLELLALNREQEVDVLATEIDHASKMKALDHSMELATLADTKRNQEWAAQVELERKQVNDHREKKIEDQAAQWALLREHHREQQDDSWTGKLHEQRMVGLEGDIELEQAGRSKQVALLNDELESRLAESKLNRERYASEQATDLQLDKIARLQELNASTNEREQRLAMEMETFRDDKSSQRGIDRINAMKGMNSDELIATAEGENAAILAGVKNNEALQGERQEMNERFITQEKEKTEAITEALKDAMSTQQAVLNTVVGNNTSTAATPPPPTAPAKDWHVSVNGERHGPYSFTELQGQVAEGLLTLSTTVWKDGFDGWKPASQVSELSQLFANSPPPPEPPAPPPPVA